MTLRSRVSGPMHHRMCEGPALPWAEVAERFRSSVKALRRGTPVFGATTRVRQVRVGILRRPKFPSPPSEIRFRASLMTPWPAPNAIVATTRFFMPPTIPLGRRYCGRNNHVRLLPPELSNRLIKDNSRSDPPPLPIRALSPSEEPPWRSRIHCRPVPHVQDPVMSCTVRSYERTIRQRAT